MAQISKSTLTFLSQLAKNNEREWFSANRKQYETSRSEFEVFVKEVIDRVVQFDPIIRGLEPGSCIFRINRDTRFSNDKSPYKTNFGAFIVRGGRKNGDKFAGYYIHIEPGSSMVAGGAYMPPSPWLSSIRQSIADDPAEFLKITGSKSFRDAFGSLTGEKVKTAPRGYSADHPNIELLKHKSYLVVRELSDKEVTSPDFFDRVISLAKAMKPFNEYLTKCSDH